VKLKCRIASFSVNNFESLLGIRYFSSFFAANCSSIRGNINGALPIRLPHSGIDVKMSNCVRIRKDGRNEVFGVEPDVKIPWAGDDPLAATQELAKVVTGVRR
jgi:hypothetical protein